jgi:hypothetical protein
MYQVVEPGAGPRFVDRHVERGGAPEQRPHWERLFARAEENYQDTLRHLNHERELLLPMIYAIPGPELG